MTFWARAAGQLMPVDRAAVNRDTSLAKSWHSEKCCHMLHWSGGEALPHSCEEGGEFAGMLC
jgi:hypothetical protein